MTERNPETPPPGSRVVLPYGKYFLVRKFAEGGMAEIFLGKHVGARGFERNVVIKRLLPHMSRVSEFIEMFLDEARLAARLTHSNIVQIHDLGVAGGSYYICMEYLPGEDLSAIIRETKRKQRPIPANVAARIILETCDALHFAHESSEAGRPLNIVHRDVSPSNILVTFAGGVKVLDFGIAKAETRLVKTQTGMLKGKHIYMAPEQIQGDEADRRADIFALGITFFELLTGVRIFQRDNELAILQAVLTDPIPSVRKYRPDIPEALETILWRALERDRDRRYPTAAAMRADLEGFISASTSATGGAQLASYLRDLFGQKEFEAKTQIPSLQALADAGYDVPPEALDPSHVPDATVENSHVDLAQVPTVAVPPLAPPKAKTAPTEIPPTRVARPGEAGPPGSKTPLALTLGVALGFAVAGLVATLVVSRRGSPGVDQPPPITAPVAATPVTPAKPPTAQPVPEPVPATPTPAPEVTPTPTTTAKKPSKPEPIRPLSKTSIASAVTASREKLMSCFYNNRDALQSDKGIVTITLSIAQSGQVTASKVVTPNFQSGPISTCLVRESKRIKFPRHVDKEVTVTLPFEYELAR
jgi:serine/threonine protein kinase